MTMNAALLRAPAVAWPTIALAFAATGLWAAAGALALLGVLPPAVGFGLATLAAYAAFTPMHDAAHRSVGRARWLNEAVGRLASLPLLAPFPAFRAMHLAHHKHANEPERDPDHWSGRGPAAFRPLRWLTQDLHYYERFFRTWGRFSPGERAEVVGGIAAIAVGVGAAVGLGLGLEVVLYVLLPARLATGALAFAFDYLPHRPHETPARADRLRATHVIRGRWLTVPLMAQNYHLVHHLYPAVPFYGYARVWADQREQLLARGAREVALLGSVD